MIVVESAHIVEFRGIRDLTIKLDTNNYAVCGPNGTGKSGIVDALEFGLTGNISRLSGKGRGLVSVKEHGPHVNIRNQPEKALVTLEVSIPSINKKARITRNVKAPRTPIIEPDEPDIKAAFAHMEQHPEFALSRREIIKYVLAEPGERAKEVQALLQLDKLETTRALLLKISNACQREEKPLDNQRSLTGNALMRALNIDELKQSALLKAVNKKRKLLGLTELAKIESTTSIRDGLEAQAKPPTIKVPKSQAKDDIAAFKAAIKNLDASEYVQKRLDAIEFLEKLKENENSLSGIERDQMLLSALKYFDGEHCPVCITKWEPEKFRELVTQQRSLLAEIAEQRENIEKQLGEIVAPLEVVSSLLQSLISYARNVPEPLDAEPFTKLKDDLSKRIKSLRAFLPLENTIASLSDDIVEIESATNASHVLEKAVLALPEPTDRDAARDFLTVGQERLDAWRNASLSWATAKKRSDLSRRAHEIYSKTSDRALQGIYKDVEAEFRAFYRAVNSDDEGAFEAQLTPSLGKLGFEVDFYGKGFFPPGAYHSEGHQDGMGLCLYLALMKHLLGNRFTFSVLDDVLMSVDSSHRRQVCELLKVHFPNTQFVLTTHDNVWLNHMRTSKLLTGKSSITFRKWHVDHGPSEWKDSDVWAEIDDLVEKNEIRAAAAQLRHYLEYVAAEWCDRLGGKVEYRNDGKYELGDLLPGAIAEMNSLLKKAKLVAQGWGDSAKFDELNVIHAEFSAVVANTSIEHWQLNPSVHYNEWANLQRADFKPVVTAYKALELSLECSSCGEPLYLIRNGKMKEALRCACSHVNINLKEKAKLKSQD